MIWLLFLAIALVTLGLRSVFIVSDGGADSTRFDTLRRFVPVAALTALIVPSILPRDGEPAPARIATIALAALVAWRTKNVLVTVIVGLVVFAGIVALSR